MKIKFECGCKSETYDLAENKGEAVDFHWWFCEGHKELGVITLDGEINTHLCALLSLVEVADLAVKLGSSLDIIDEKEKIVKGQNTTLKLYQGACKNHRATIAERDATIAEQARRLEYSEGVIGWMEQEFHPDRPYGEADTKYQNEMSAKREG